MDKRKLFSKLANKLFIITQELQIEIDEDGDIDPESTVETINEGISELEKLKEYIKTLIIVKGE